MKRFFFATPRSGRFARLGGAGQSAQPQTILLTKTNAFTPDTIPWGPAPAGRAPGRAQFAVLEGDPTASTGDFTIRLKMPDGFPH